VIAVNPRWSLGYRGPPTGKGTGKVWEKICRVDTLTVSAQSPRGPLGRSESSHGARSIP
jgi:hypothetical protein